MGLKTKPRILQVNLREKRLIDRSMFPDCSRLGIVDLTEEFVRFGGVDEQVRHVSEHQKQKRERRPVCGCAEPSQNHVQHVQLVRKPELQEQHPRTMYNTSSLSANRNYKNNIPEPCTTCPAFLQTGTTRTTSQNHVQHIQLVRKPELQEQHPRTMYNMSSFSANRNYKNNIPEPCTTCLTCLPTGTTRTTSQNHVKHIQLVHKLELQEQHPRTMYNMSSLSANRNYKNNIPEPCTTCPAFLQTGTTRTTSQNHVQHV